MKKDQEKQVIKPKTKDELIKSLKDKNSGNEILK